jgi:hypothetical protein
MLDDHEQEGLDSFAALLADTLADGTTVYN